MRPWSQAYSTPLVIRVGDRDQVVSVGAFRAAAYDPLSGEEIWRVSYPDGFSNVPRPVYGHGLVFIATGFNDPSLLAVRVDGKGDVTRTHVAWTLRRGAPLTPSPLLVGDLLYIVSDIGIATCLDAKTGQTLWQQRLGGNYSASPIFADGRIYFLSEEGVATVIAPGTTFQKLATNVLDGATLASMAVSDRSIFIRIRHAPVSDRKPGCPRCVDGAATCAAPHRAADECPGDPRSSRRRFRERPHRRIGDRIRQRGQAGSPLRASALAARHRAVLCTPLPGLPRAVRSAPPRQPQ